MSDKPKLKVERWINICQGIGNQITYVYNSPDTALTSAEIYKFERGKDCLAVAVPFVWEES